VKIGKCIICEQEFSYGSSRGKYCSYLCYWKSLRGKKIEHIQNKKGICMNSGRTHFKKGFTPWNKDRPGYATSKKGKKYPQYSGDKSSNWKEGLTESRGYILVHSPNHPFRDAHNYVKRSRLVMEKIMGQYLNYNERVHHINGDKTDDRPENLMYFSNESKHQKFHHPKGKCCCL
jgi:uncharacterized protein (DUF1330 family)